MQNENEWLKERVAYIRGLKSPSDQQAILAELATKQTREPSEEKKLSALVKAEKASIRAAKARQQAANLIHAEKKAEREAERKARNHRLILQGVLFDLAGLEGRSRGELLGLLLAAASSSDEQKWASWKNRGDALLAEKENEEAARKGAKNGRD